MDNTSSKHRKLKPCLTPSMSEERVVCRKATRHVLYAKRIKFLKTRQVMSMTCLPRQTANNVECCFHRARLPTDPDTTLSLSRPGDAHVVARRGRLGRHRQRHPSHHRLHSGGRHRALHDGETHSTDIAHHSPVAPDHIRQRADRKTLERRVPSSGEQDDVQMSRSKPRRLLRSVRLAGKESPS